MDYGLDNQPSLLLHSCNTGIRNPKNPQNFCLGELAAMTMPGVKVYAPQKAVTAFELEIMGITPASIDYNTESGAAPLKLFHYPFTVTKKTLSKKIEIPENQTNDLYSCDLRNQLKNSLAEFARDGNQTLSQFANHFSDILLRITMPNRQDFEIRLLQILDLYKNNPNKEINCRMLMKNTTSNYCETRYIETLENELNNLKNFDTIRSKLYAFQNELIDQVLLDNFLTQDMIKEFCLRSQCSTHDEKWHLSFFNSNYQLHYVRAIKEVLKNDLGLSNTGKIDNHDRKVISTILNNSENIDSLKKRFISAYKNKILDYYQTYLNDHVINLAGSSSNFLNEIKNNSSIPECRETSNILTYDEINNNAKVTRFGTYCYLLTIELIEATNE
jgi:hypothetical protein